MITDTVIHDYCEITQSPTHETPSSTGDYHVLEGPSEHSTTIPSPVRDEDSKATNASTHEIPMTTHQKAIYTRCDGYDICLARQDKTTCTCM